MCLVAGFAPRQKQIIQGLLFLPPLIQLISAPLLLAEFAENLAILMRGLIDGQLLDALSFKLPQPRPQPVSHLFQFHLAFCNFQKMNGRQYLRQILFPLYSEATLFFVNLLQLQFNPGNILHDAMQDCFFGVLHALPKAQNRIEAETKCHI